MSISSDVAMSSPPPLQQEASVERFSNNRLFDYHLWQVIDQFDPSHSVSLLMTLAPQAIRRLPTESLPFEERFQLSQRCIEEAPTLFPDEPTFSTYFVCLSRFLTIPSTENRDVLPLFLKAIEKGNGWIFSLLMKNQDLTRQLTPPNFKAIYLSISKKGQPTFLRHIPIRFLDEIIGRAPPSLDGLPLMTPTLPKDPSISFPFEQTSTFPALLLRFAQEPSSPLHTNLRIQRLFLSKLFCYGSESTISSFFSSDLFKQFPIDLLLNECRRWPHNFPHLFYFSHLRNHPQFFNTSLDDLCNLLSRWGDPKNRLKNQPQYLTPFLTHPQLSELHSRQKKELSSIAQRDRWILQLVKDAPDLIEPFDSLISSAATLKSRALITAILSTPRGQAIPHNHLQNALRFAKIQWDSAPPQRGSTHPLTHLIQGLQTYRPDFPIPPELLALFAPSKRKADAPPEDQPSAKRRQPEGES